MSDDVLFRIAYDKMCEALNEVLYECVTEGQARSKTVQRVRALLPAKYSMAYKPKGAPAAES